MFEWTGSSQGAAAVKDMDTNVLTGLLKLFFRELPEALFTDTGYPEFVKGIGRLMCLLDERTSIWPSFI